VTPIPTPVADPGLAARYEELRRQVRDGAGTATGLFLFLRHGMRAWMQTPLSSAASCREPDEKETGRDANAAPRSRAGLVLVLAAMALSRREGRGR